MDVGRVQVGIKRERICAGDDRKHNLRKLTSLFISLLFNFITIHNYSPYDKTFALLSRKRQIFSFFLSLPLSLTHTYMHAHARAYTNTHARTYTCSHTHHYMLCIILYFTFTYHWYWCTRWLVEIVMRANSAEVNVDNDYVAPHLSRSYSYLRTKVAASRNEEINPLSAKLQ